MGYELNVYVFYLSALSLKFQLGKSDIEIKG